MDGGSNFVVYATLALNKDAGSLYAGYKQAVKAFGSRPLKVRADMCWEAAAMIGADIIQARGRQAYLTGPSTANQVFFIFFCVLRLL